MRTFDASFDDTWAALVEHASSTFFAISSFEKSSGLMTLTFGSDQPARFIDCGHITADVAGRKIDMPYAQFLVDFHRATLQGRMNLLARRDSDARTTVRVNSRYVFQAPASPSSADTTFSFDGESRQTLTVVGAMSGSGNTRTCGASGEAERQILDGIERALTARKR